MLGITPLFNNEAIFGPAAKVVARANPVARVTRGFAGLNGLVTKRLGTRGAMASAVGVLVGSTSAYQAAAEGAFEEYKIDGGAYTLYDTLGRTWTNMILVEFEPLGAVIQDASGFLREYHAMFVGLSQPF